MPKIYLIACEESGDNIGAKIINSMQELASTRNIENQYHGICGNNMINAGAKPLFKIDKLNVMGFCEVLMQIPRILTLIKNTIKHIEEIKPDILITIDGPAFTFRVAKKIRKILPDIEMIHVVAPSVWAYKEHRAKEYANIYDKMLTLFQFEVEYFTKHGLETYSIGHPCIKSITKQDDEQNDIDREKIKKHFNIKHDVIAITPGSRKSEITRHMPVIVSTLQNISNTRKFSAIFLQQNTTHIKLLNSFLEHVDFDFQILHNYHDKIYILSISNCAIAKSGTNNLELSAASIPIIVIYKLNWISYFMIRTLIKVKHINLINIIANKPIIPELIQDKCNSNSLENNLIRLLNNKDNCAKQQIEKVSSIIRSIKNDNDMGYNASNIILERYL